MHPAQQPRRVAVTGIRFEMTPAGFDALIGRKKPKAPRRKRERCACNHRGSMHTSRGECLGDDRKCRCQELRPVAVFECPKGAECDRAAGSDICLSCALSEAVSQ